jgi:hypothetical protein
MVPSNNFMVNVLGIWLWLESPKRRCSQGNGKCAESHDIGIDIPVPFPHLSCQKSWTGSWLGRDQVVLFISPLISHNAFQFYKCAELNGRLRSQDRQVIVLCELSFACATSNLQRTTLKLPLNHSFALRNCFDVAT